MISRMIQIEAYSLDFDKNDYNSGMSGKVFVNQYSKGECDGYECKSIAEAFMKLGPEKVAEAELLYCYRDGEEQRFVRFGRK